MWTGKAVVVLPPPQIHLVNKPDNEIITFPALVDNIQLPYYIHDRVVIENVIHFEVSRKDLTEKLVARQAAPTVDEVDACSRELWGTYTKQWKSVNGWETCGTITARVALRTLVGYPMCRNETLREQTQLFANALFASSAIINCLPPAMRPIVGPVLALKANYHGRRCRQVLIPFIKEGIYLWESSKQSEEAAELPARSSPPTRLA